MSTPHSERLYDEGRRAYEQGRYDIGIRNFAQALKAEPKNAAAMLGMASCLTKVNRYAEAMQVLQKAVKLKPMAPEIHTLMGFIDRTCLHEGAAVTHYQRALAIRAGFPPAAAGLADLYRKLGRHDEAIDIVEGAIAASERPDPHLAEAYAGLAVRAGRVPEAIAYTRRVLEGRLTPMGRVGLLFGLAELLNKSGDHERAWDAVAEANALRPVRWDPEAYSRLVDHFLEFWTRDRLRSLPTSGRTTREPVFVVGMPRSGTTLIEQIIAAHPEGAGAGEINEMMAIGARLHGSAHERFMGFPSSTSNYTIPNLSREAEQYRKVARDIAARLGGPIDGATRIVDKLPYNYHMLPLIQLLFPKAAVIHTVRDPRDTCVSCWFQNFLGPLGYTANVDHLARYHADHDRIMAHLKRELDIPILDVRYEDLVANPEPGIRRILEHVGLPFHEGCLKFHESTRAVYTASVEQVRRPMYTSSTQRWRRYGPKAEPLLQALERAGVVPPGAARD